MKQFLLCFSLFFLTIINAQNKPMKLITPPSLQKGDTIAIVAPAGILKNRKHVIDKAKKPFYIINTSRGQCIETNALIKGLNDKKILGACLDVFEQEKNSFEKISKNADLKYLIESSKTILTPHIAGWTFESNYKIAVTLSKKIINLVQKS